MPITVKSNRVQQPLDTTIPTKWLSWMPLGLAVLANAALVPDLMAGWGIAVLVGYAAVLIGLSRAYEYTAARVVARVLALLLPVVWVALMVILLFVGDASLRVLLEGKDGWLGESLQYCLFNSCGLLLPFWLAVQAGVGCMAAKGRKFDNNLLRFFSIVSLFLMIAAFFYFDTERRLDLFQRVFQMSYTIQEPLFHTLLCLSAAAVAVLSFVVFPPFADRIRRYMNKKGAKSE